MSNLEPHEGFPTAILNGDPEEPPRFEVHTSERITFRRCRRKWFFSSPNRLGLIPLLPEAAVNEHLWFGTGFHWALEDFHGYQVYGPDPTRSFRAYVVATRRALPENYKELITLADGMLGYYLDWYWKPQNGWFQTLYRDSKPMVEVDWSVELQFGADIGSVFYAGIFDRVVEDQDSRIWLVDYKTAARIDTSKLEMDPQVTAYCWAYELLFGQAPEGMIYLQFLKQCPGLPAENLDGSLSVNKTQAISYDAFRRAVIARHGREKKNIPTKYLEYLKFLKQRGENQGDPFIRMDLVRRNPDHIRSEAWKIQAEILDMTNPGLPLYPNPTRDCVWDCGYRGLCVAMDDGSDWQGIVQEGYQQKNTHRVNSWKQNLPTPKVLEELLERGAL